MTDYQQIHPSQNHKVWYGLRNLCIGDDEETRIWDELAQWPEPARRLAQPYLEQSPVQYVKAYRAVLKWSIHHEMGRLNNLRLFLLVERYLITNIPEEVSNAICLYALYRELEKES